MMIPASTEVRTVVQEQALGLWGDEQVAAVAGRVAEALARKHPTDTWATLFGRVADVMSPVAGLLATGQVVPISGS